MEIKIVELKQRHIEAFATEMPPGRDLPFPIFWGETVRAACKCGWFVEPVFKPEDVAEMEPGKVRELCTAVMEKYNKALEISPS
jgi:hypothetical protein